jgi:hypothetical protein
VARIRSLHPNFFKDEDIKDLPPLVRLFFQGLWCYSDKDGRGKVSFERMKIEIMPYDADFNVSEAWALLTKKKKNGNGQLVYEYDVDGCKYYQIAKWFEYQHPHRTERESVIPPPPDMQLTVSQPLDNRESRVVNGNRLMVNGSSVNTPAGQLSEADFVNALKANPAYVGIDVDAELGRMDAWLLTKPGRKKTRRFVVNWLNRIDKPLNAGVQGKSGGWKK